MLVDSVQVVGVGAGIGCGDDPSHAVTLETTMTRITRRIA